MSIMHKKLAFWCNKYFVINYVLHDRKTTLLKEHEMWIIIVYINLLEERLTISGCSTLLLVSSELRSHTNHCLQRKQLYKQMFWGKKPRISTSLRVTGIPASNNGIPAVTECLWWWEQYAVWDVNWLLQVVQWYNLKTNFKKKIICNSMYNMIHRSRIMT